MEYNNKTDDLLNLEIFMCVTKPISTIVVVDKSITNEVIENTINRFFRENDDYMDEDIIPYLIEKGVVKEEFNIETDRSLFM